MKCTVSPGLLAGGNDSAAPVVWSRRGFCAGVAVGAAVAAAPGSILASSASNASVDALSSRPVKIIVSASTGGAADMLVRVLTKGMSSNLGITFVMDYQGAATGTVAAQQLLRTEPDGHTWLVTHTASHAISPGVNSALGYDPVRDFSHLNILGGSPWTLVVHPDSRVNTWAEWLVQARQAVAGGVSIGSPGEISQGHLIGQQLSVLRGFSWTHVPYRSTQAMLTDVAGGHLQAGLATTTSAAGLIRSGRLRPLFVTSTRRLADYPQVPTVAELGVPEVTVSLWFGLAVAAEVDPALRARIQRAVASVVAKPDWASQLRTFGLEPLDVAPEAAGEFVAAEGRKWGPVARALKLAPQTTSR
jgi:tripartite-type tricarboxylate transporter receptor subunit TctC